MTPSNISLYFMNNSFICCILSHSVVSQTWQHKRTCILQGLLHVYILYNLLLESPINFSFQCFPPVCRQNFCYHTFFPIKAFNLLIDKNCDTGYVLHTIEKHLCWPIIARPLCYILNSRILIHVNTRKHITVHSIKNHRKLGIRNDHLNGSLKNEAKTRTWENLRMADANSILPLSAFKLRSLYSRSVNSKYGNQRKKTKKQKNGQTGKRIKVWRYNELMSVDFKAWVRGCHLHLRWRTTWLSINRTQITITVSCKRRIYCDSNWTMQKLTSFLYAMGRSLAFCVQLPN